MITGGPCSGKTTLLEHLARQGRPTVPEAALSVLERLNAQMGPARQQSWRKENPMAFQQQILELQIQREQAAQRRHVGTVFVDRGRLDGIAYLRLAGVDPPLDFLKTCLQIRYRAVFLLSTLTRFEARPDTGRTESAECSQEIAAQIHQVYEQNQYSVVSVPEMPVAERAELVLKAISSPL